jgi:hypothetical protein
MQRPSGGVGDDKEQSSSWSPVLSKLEHVSSDHAVPAAAQAFHDDRFSPLACIDGARDASGQSACDGAACRIRIVIRSPDQGAGTGAENGGPGRFLIELALIPGEGLAGSKIAPEGYGRLSV